MAACVTTAKGRLSGVIFVSAAENFLRIDAEPELREPLAARLEQYIISDDAALEDVTGEECMFHVLFAGSGTASIGLPTACKIRVAKRFARAGVDIIAPHAQYEAVRGSLAELHTYTLIPETLAESMRIEAGIPRWGAELDEETLPPEAGLDQTAIDYNKGCYIGQEVISRIKSVGHVNRRLAGFTAAQPLAAGMTLHPPGEPEKAAGRDYQRGVEFRLGMLGRPWLSQARIRQRHPGCPFARWHGRHGSGARSATCPMKKIALFLLLALACVALNAARAQDTAYFDFRIDHDPTLHRVAIALDSNAAPGTVANFEKLIRHHFYNGLKVHRVIPHTLCPDGRPAFAPEGSLEGRHRRPRLHAAAGDSSQAYGGRRGHGPSLRCH